MEFEVEVEKFIYFLVTFFKKTPKFSTFFFKYVINKVDNERFDYGIWRRNTMYLWIQIDLCTPFEVDEKIEHLYHFFGHFWDWREKCSKSRFYSLQIMCKGFFTWKFPYNLYSRKTWFWVFFRAKQKNSCITLTKLAKRRNDCTKLPVRI